MKAPKTNAARLLDKSKRSYELVSYPVDESDLSAVHVAATLGQPIERVFKTLVLKGDRTGCFVCILPGNGELNLKTTAKLTGNKSCDMLPLKDLLPTTGYLRGACSPIGMKKRLPTFIDESCLNFDSIYVSAGLRGLQIFIAPQDLIAEIDAVVVALSDSSGPES